MATNQTRYDRSELFTKPELRERGWTDALVKRFLPENDDVRDNPYSKKAGLMRLYKKETVQAIENMDEFAAAKIKPARQKEFAKKAVKTKEETLRSWA